MKENQKRINPITYKKDGLIVTVYSTNKPSPEAIRNTNRKINEIMNKRYAKSVQNRNENA
ncbi:hypothetical protein CIB87_21310 [Priestia megaterium]|uniref:Uncharacterized protein n=1 Tax=Priestia megaterium TaxID=1404 RepID=A0AA86LVT3_PRIMG|nr:hypothetical protein [Priestia megaterium]AXI31454.1 hypothetical protein CIB87_21310 [Priestia megaterium]